MYKTYSFTMMLLVLSGNKRLEKRRKKEFGP